MGDTPLFTIGHQGRTTAALIAALQANQIGFLIDVRRPAHARASAAFNPSALRPALRAAGMRYASMGDALGDPTPGPACAPVDDKTYATVAARPAYQQAIDRLQDAVNQAHRVALLCTDAHPGRCHRTTLIGRTLAEAGVTVRHIDASDACIDHAAVQRVAASASAAEMPDPFNAYPEEPEFDDHFLFDAPPLPYDDEDILPQVAFEPPPLPEFPAPAGPRDLAAARRLLRQVFGYDAFRPLQADIVAQVLAKRDTLVVMPTGSGKSLCYQLPALLFPGLTVVVSPLISLMEDQIVQLHEFGVPAVALNSTLSLEEYSWTIEQIQAGRVRLLYAAPETLVRPDTLTLLSSLPVDCLTIDEAHCISEWGHDFRPEYRQLAALRRRLPDAVCLAVTATATERVRQDIEHSLEIPRSQRYIASFDRPNLFLEVEAKINLLAQTTAFLAEHRGQSGIIYCATRRRVDSLTEQLQARGWSALPYHAGLDDRTRQENQRRFTRDDAEIIVATVAFGMGINKPDIRFILHVDLPKNLESYYQQIGRAGRDGLPANCRLLYSYGDQQTIQFLIGQQPASQQGGARQRLEAMIGFAESADCRRQTLLTYFDEADAPDECEACDNCTADEADQVDLTVPAQKLLSCALRTGQMFGTGHLIDVLRGSRSRKVLDRGHDRLPTYNIGRDHSRQEWQFLARQFIQQGLLARDANGGLYVTVKGRDVLRGEQVLGKPLETVAPAVVTQPHDPALLAQLRSRRKELADAARIPPYAVFPDRTLVEMATRLPTTRAAFGRLYGVGEAKLTRYADAFLPLLQAHRAEHGDPPPAPANATSNGQRSQAGGRRQEVATLFNAGESIAAIAETFGIKPRTVINHLWRAYQDGATLEPRELDALSTVPPDVIAQAGAAFAEHGLDFLRPVYEALGESVSYDVLHLVRLQIAIS